MADDWVGHITPTNPDLEQRVCVTLPCNPVKMRADSRHNIVFVKCKGAQKYGHRIVLGILFALGSGFFVVFFPGTICLVFATVWN